MTELTINSIKGVAYLILVSDIAETSALTYTYAFLLIYTKNIQSFNYEC
jgi:hypothetical protein